ncbi:MAG: sulfatase-like hydrolase/transferase [Acidimicrobiaceae bacterium]|nr:sulfatase-like hydrolase/transferase [Acidimicrobiaceae bacterium]MDE0606643.1 sulfatase-like hydrolase/transferase [Acidimicrobiaceae bacterium]
MVKQPNILLIVSDEERRNDWLAGKADLPAHDRLRADGLTFNRYYTHSSPCSPSRASLYTGSYLAEHGVVDNVSFPVHTALDPAIPTIGSLLADHGYYSAYLGKWHLSHEHVPEMTAHGYQDFRGNDMHYTGSAWSGRFFDPIIAADAMEWLRDHADDDTPWHLTVALVNPHDIMWFPIDHPSYQAEHPRDAKVFDFMRNLRLEGVPVEAMSEDYPERFSDLPANFHDDLHSKPEIQRAWRQVRNHEHFVGQMDLADERAWLRQLDYYAYLHEELDQNLGELLDTLDDLGVYDDTVIAYTSDHGDACGSHGLRAKLPCVYEEVMGVPLVIKVPGVTEAGATTDALATHVDLAATLCALGGVDLDETPSLSGVDLLPALADSGARPRDHVLFSQDSAQSPLLRNCRYAVRGFFDGVTKYARYYGIGGGIERDGTRSPTPKLFDVDAAFEDHDHEWYNTVEDPLELVNLAHDRSRRDELRDNFERLLKYEADAGV